MHCKWNPESDIWSSAAEVCVWEAATGFFLYHFPPREAAEKKQFFKKLIKQPVHEAKSFEKMR